MTRAALDLPPARAADRVAALLERVGVRLALSALIVLSLVPVGHGPTSDALFVAVFGVEFASRAFVFAASFRPAQDGSAVAATRRRLGSALFLLVDLLALLSFLPWPVAPDGSRWLRLFRLTRMLLLAGYWFPVVRDLWSVLSRRERARQVALLGFVVVLFAFAGAAVLEQLAERGVDFNGDGTLDAGDEAFFARLWWSFRQVQDPGNMLATPAGVVALVVSLVLTVTGLLLVSFLIGLGSDLVRELIDLSRDRPVGLRRHFVVVHATPGLPLLLRELTAYHEKLFRRVHFTVVGDTAERPQALRAPDLSRVHYRAADAHSGAFVERADVATAKRVVVLSHSGAEHADAHTASVVLAAREANPRCWIVAELLEQANASAARVAGGPRTTLAPTEKFLALYVAHAIRQPERLPLARDLMTSQQGHEVYTYFFDYDDVDDASGASGALTPAVAPSFDWLYREGLRAPLDARVLPIGVFVGFAAGDGERARTELHLGAAAAPADRAPAGPVRAVIAVARDFASLERFGQHLRGIGLERAIVDEERPRRPLPAFAPPPTPRRLTRVLLCGYRPATIDLAATLMAAHPGVTVLLLMAHAESYAQAETALREHAMHIRAGLWQEHGPWGTFEDLAPGSWTFRPHGDGEAIGRLDLVVADWMSERTLLALPGSGAHLGTMDLVALLGGLNADLDWRTAMTVLKIADIVRAQPERFGRDFEVVAGVRDPDLGRRLRQSYGRAVGTRTRGIRVFATEHLRALFTFQSVAVPGFDAISSELLGPWGQGFTRLEATPGARQEPGILWSFLELGLALRARGETLVAIELTPGARGGAQRARRSLDPEDDDPRGDLLAPPELNPSRLFSQSDLVAAWVLRPDA